MKAIVKRLKSKTYWAAMTGAALVIVEHNSGFISQYLPADIRSLVVLLWPLLMITLREITTTAIGDK